MAYTTKSFRKRRESLLSVDDMVETVVNALATAGKLDNTIIVFTSDNGFFEGQHRQRAGKILLYEASIRVPLLIRGPGISKGQIRTQLVNNLDLAATIQELTGLTPGLTPDGRSLTPVIQDAAAPWRTSLLVQGKDIVWSQPLYDGRWKAVRTSRYMYAEHTSTEFGFEQEFYDLAADPYQLASKPNDPAYASVVTDLQDKLSVLKTCAGATCWMTTPVPPPPSNLPPVAYNQPATTAEDTAKPITLAATDSEGQPLTYSIVGQPAHGTLTGTAPNVTYTPASNYNGSDSLTFNANNGVQDSNIATVSITITSVNDSPIASFSVNASSGNAPLTVSFNASASSDFDGTIGSFTWVFGDGQTGNGLTVSHTYTTSGSFTAVLTVTDNQGATGTTSKLISVNVHSNLPPVASTQSVTTAEDTAKLITLTATDPEGQPLTYSIVAQPAHGTLTGTAPNVTFTPFSNYNGSDSFTFKANDGVQNSNIATVSITMTSVNDAPTASFTATPNSGTAPLTVSFNASASSDFDGTISAYTWVFGDGQAGNGVTVSHTYTTSGSFTAVLTVKDNQGATRTASKVIVAVVTFLRPRTPLAIGNLTMELELAPPILPAAT